MEGSVDIMKNTSSLFVLREYFIWNAEKIYDK